MNRRDGFPFEETFRINGLVNISNPLLFAPSGIVYFSTFHFIMTLFMIIERIYSLLTEYLSCIEKELEKH
ncbi:MAG: hypothetical protein R6V83_10615 [Candidatus Thorarchaeota archaeon]